MTARGRAKLIDAERAPAPPKKKEVGQPPAGHRSTAGSNYGDYVPNRSTQGPQRGGEERVDPEVKPSESGGT